MDHVTIICPVCEKPDKKTEFGVYLKCSACESIFLKHFPTKKDIQKVSDEYADVIFEPDDDKITSTHTDRLKDLTAYIPQKSKILDIGCGNGVFLKCAANNGYIPYAMDISPKIVRHLENEGIEGYMTMKEIPERHFQAATAFDVIEHTTNPHRFVEDIKTKIKKKGIVMLTTPNAIGISGRILKSKWWAFGPDNHYIVFSPYGLKLLLEKNGFEIISLKTDSFTQWFVPSNTFLKKVANKAIYMLYSPLKKYIYNHHLGDNIQIIARLTK